MSWYNFPGPVQGGFGPLGAEDDEKRRRRRDAYRDAGAPYQGASSGVQQAEEPGLPGPSAADAAWGMPQAPAGAGAPQQRQHAPRQAAAVDMGQGAEQPQWEAYAGGRRPHGLQPQDVTPSGPPRRISLRAVPALEASGPEEEKRQHRAAVRPAQVLSEGVPGDAQPAHVVQVDGAGAGGKLEHAARALDAMPDDDLAVKAEPVQRRAVRRRQPKPFMRGGVARLRSDVPPDPRDRRVRFKGDDSKKGGFGPSRAARRPPGAPGAPYQDPSTHPSRYRFRRGEHKRAWKKEDKKFEIEGAGELRRIAAQDPEQPPAVGPQHVTPDPTPKGTKKEHVVQPQHVTPGRPSFKKGKLGRARSARSLYKDHAQRQQERADALEQESEHLKGQQVQLGGMLQDTRKQAAQEKRRTLAQMRKKNRSMLDQMGRMSRGARSLDQRHKKEKGIIVDLARDALGQAEQQRQDIIGKGRRAIQMVGDQAIAQQMRMRQQHQQQVGGLQGQLQRQQRAADEAMRTNQATRASMQDQLRRQQQQAAEAQRVGGAQLRSQQDRITGMQQRIGSLTKEGNELLRKTGENIQRLQSQIDQGSATSASLRDALKKAEDDLKAARQQATQGADLSAADKKRMQDEIRRMATDLQNAKKDLRSERSRPAGPSRAAAPIVVQGGAGGGGASSSAGGSSAASGGGSAARAPDLSKGVEAVKSIAAAKDAKGAARKGGTKGITQARRSYTDKRKTKIAELRALKGKRIREFNARTKKMPKAERDKARREFKKRVNAQFKEAQQRFPTARGLKTVAALRELIRKLDAFRPAK